MSVVLFSPSFLRTFGPAADREAALGWVLLVIASLVVLVVTVLVVAGVLRNRDGAAESVARTGGGLRWIVLGGIVVPTIILVGVFILTVATQSAVAAPARPASLTVRVTGHQWWWEVHYLDPSPDRIATTANEIHIPVGRPVRLELQAGDVIHSFWVPELAGKTDVVPGQRNVMWLEATRPGVYHGQCAEYCGMQHAKMAMEVVAEPPEAFARWFARQREPAARLADSVSDSAAIAGEAVFARSACALCHTVRGTLAGGRLGPDLTHVGGRRTIAAGTVANTHGNLLGWIENPQAFKPGTQMPAVPLAGRDLQDLAAYLEHLQ